MTAVDQDARTRIAAGMAEALFVEAGAGTGKTTALVQRVVTLVARGEQLTSFAGLAAITFTENAASELRHRIRTALADAATQLAEPEQRERCAAALDGLDDAAITTLHGFAQRILADLPLEADLPPGFQVEDEVRAALHRDRWWTSYLDASLDDTQLTQVWRTALTLGLQPNSLRPVAEQFAANWDLLPAEPACPATLPPWRVDGVITALRAVVDRYAPVSPQGDALGIYLREVLQPGLVDLTLEPDDLGRAAVLAGLPNAPKGNAAAWAKVGLHKADVTAALSEVADVWQPQLHAVRSAVLTILLDRLRLAVLSDADRRRAEGRLHFHDLLVRARDLLRDDQARAILSSRWQVLLVDEFQDTDPLQAELVHLLAAGSSPLHWEQAEVQPGRLFFVGDPKQSIYRFRRADVGLYQQVQGLVADGQLQLVQNFRSRPAVLEVVNAAIAPLMAAGGTDQVAYVPLQPSRPPVPADPGPDVLLLGGPHDEAVGQVRQVEAAHVAQVCRRARDEGWLVRDGDALRPVRFADIALLVPTRTSLSALEDALQSADVPYRVESRSLVWQTDAVRDLLTLLEAIDDPGDEVAVVGALRHPGFACSDDDLMSWKAAGGGWSPFGEAPAGQVDSPVAAALVALRAYHDLRWWLPLNQLVDRVVRDRHLVELTTALPRPRDHWRRLRFVVDQSRAFLDAGGDGLRPFVRWAREQADRGADAIESAVPEPDDDAVRILTVHASKGLEFPVVVLTGINVDDQTRGPVSWAAGRAEVKVKDFRTAGWDAARARETMLDRAESVRVLYVGSTRAVDHLVVSLHHKASTSRNHAARLHGLLAELLGAGAVHEVEMPLVVGALTEARQALAFAPAEHRAFLAARKVLLADVDDRLPVTPSGLAAASTAQEPIDPLEEVDDVIEPALVHKRPARGGAALGSVVHRALQLVDFAQPDVQGAVRTATREAGAPELAAAAEQRVRAALDSPVLKEVHNNYWKELPVVAELDGRLVEGFVDLVIETPDGLVVVDYKTDATPDDETLAAKVRHYTPQLRAYAQAVTCAAQRPVVDALLLFVGADEAVVRPVPLQ